MPMTTRPIRRLLLAVLIVALAAPAAAQQVSIPYETFTLPNGLRFLVNEDRSTPIVAVDVWYHVGSGYEDVGRTGFAHLFEHILFEGSRYVPEGDFDNLLEAAGAVNNGSTTTDRTNYFEILPSNALELALWLEADRMGALLEAMTPSKLEIQRDVVKNERRQSYENRPYGMFWIEMADALYPDDHPYSWPTIGSMEDLTAASLEDVESFFRRYYAPNNAVIAVSGDVDADRMRELAHRYFAWIPAGEPVDRPDVPMPPLTPDYRTLEDRVTLPQVNLMWRTGPAFSDDDAALDVLASILASGKNSRLYRRLVYDEQTAQSVSSFNYSRLLSGDFFIRVTAKEGSALDAMERDVMEEVERLARDGPTPEELERVRNVLETDFVTSLERAIGRAESLQGYFYYTGDPGYADEHLAAYRAVGEADIRRVARRYLVESPRLVISIVPQGRTELAATAEEVTP